MQLGIVVHGTKIVSVSPGSPAHELQELSRGDETVAVNGAFAPQDNIHKRLGTEHFLGSPAAITIATEVLREP